MLVEEHRVAVKVSDTIASAAIEVGAKDGASHGLCIQGMVRNPDRRPTPHASADGNGPRT